jgi:hypothetical protein
VRVRGKRLCERFRSQKRVRLTALDWDRKPGAIVARQVQSYKKDQSERHRASYIDSAKLTWRGVHYGTSPCSERRMICAMRAPLSRSTSSKSVCSDSSAYARSMPLSDES